jgi:uncharacterized SAM-binding protein YcdF (DUF218 family)
MFELKRVFGALLMPMPIAALLAIAAFLAWRLKRYRLARIALIASVSVAFISSLEAVGSGLLRPLEYRYSATLHPGNIEPPPRYVAVLGSGYSPSDDLPITASFDSEGIGRLTESVSLLRQLPGAQLIVSGGSIDGHPPSAHGYAQAAIALGVSVGAIIVIDAPRDTGAEILAIHTVVGESSVILVTSAAHMPRAMAYCARVGLHAVPAPTGNRTRLRWKWTPGSLVPSGRSLGNTEIALHEYLGLLAMKLGVA